MAYRVCCVNCESFGSGAASPCTTTIGAATSDALQRGASGADAVSYGVAGVFGKDAADDVLQSAVSRVTQDKSVQTAQRVAELLHENVQEQITQTQAAHISENLGDTLDNAILETLNPEAYRAATAPAQAANAQIRQTAPTQQNAVTQGVITGTQFNIDNTGNDAYNYDTGGVTNGYPDQLDRASGARVRDGRNGATVNRIVQDRFGNVGRGNLQFSGIVLLSPKSQRTLTKRGIVNVELHDSSADSAAFSYALDAARAADLPLGYKRKCNLGRWPLGQ